jgi:2-polyprenyl-3-methyl-5-hydroxy-6-metoxy-1,4-benzoquinol methylase
MYSVKACPICNSDQLQQKFSCRDYTVSNELFELTKCEECNLLITNPRPEDLAKYYISDDYLSHSNKITSPLSLTYNIARYFAVRSKFRLIKSYDKGTVVSLLDYGCGTGDFLHYCAGQKALVQGVEPSSKAREIAKAKSLDVKENLTQVNQKFTAITLWHVLEHIPDMNETLDKLIARIEQNGIIVIAVPNHESYDATIYKEYWAGYDVPRHLWHFSKLSMTKLFEKHQLSLINITPLKLDAFYVSMLSEKYIHGSTRPLGLLNALRNGIVSNKVANTNTNYSSLIYIGKRK